MTDRIASDVAEARLNHLIDRARRGALLPAEADQFTTGLRDLVRRLEDTEDDLRRVQQKACSVAEALRLNSQRLDAVLADRETERAARAAEEKRARAAAAARDQARVENVDARAAIERLKLLVAASSEPGQAVRMAAQYAERAIENGKRAEEAEAALGEARMWARHGYEIGQRSCTWSDYGVAPAWLTETAALDPPQQPTTTEA